MHVTIKLNGYYYEINENGQQIAHHSGSEYYYKHDQNEHDGNYGAVHANNRKTMERLELIFP